MILFFVFIFSLLSVEYKIDFSKGNLDNLSVSNSSMTLSGLGLEFSNSNGGRWNYYQKFSLINNSTYTYSNFRIKISTKFDYKRMNDDGSDIRFVVDSKEIPYYIENWDTGAISEIWIKISTISANSTKDIYLYYGNHLAISNSNLESTFVFYDDFDSLDSDKWQEDNPYGEYEIKIENNKLSIYGDEKESYGGEDWWSGVELKIKNKEFKAPLVIEYEIIPDTYVNSGRTALFLDDGTNKFQWGWLYSENDRIYTPGRFESNNFGSENFGGPVEVGKTYYYKILINENGDISFYLDDSLKKTVYSVFKDTFTISFKANCREKTGAKMKSFVDNLKIYRTSENLSVMKEKSTVSGSYTQEISFPVNIELKGLRWVGTASEGTSLDFYLYSSSNSEWREVTHFVSPQSSSTFSYKTDRVKLKVDFKTDYSTKTPVLNSIILDYETLKLYNSASSNYIFISTEEVKNILKEDELIIVKEVSKSTPVFNSSFEKLSKRNIKDVGSKVFYLEAKDIYGNKISFSTNTLTINFPYDYLETKIPISKLKILKVSDDGNAEILKPEINEKSKTFKVKVNTLSYFTIVAFSPVETFLDSILIYPNPFNPPSQDVTISYVLKETSEIEARIWTLTGELVRKFKFVESGDPDGIEVKKFKWNGKNGEGRICSNGTYILSLKAKTLGSGKEKEIIKKIAILR